jgi:hypothetical protein
VDQLEAAEVDQFQTGGNSRSANRGDHFFSERRLHWSSA